MKIKVLVIHLVILHLLMTAHYLVADSPGNLLPIVASACATTFISHKYLSHTVTNSERMLLSSVVALLMTAIQLLYLYVNSQTEVTTMTAIVMATVALITGFSLTYICVGIVLSSIERVKHVS